MNRELEKKLAGCRVLVVGDLMLDRWIEGAVGRISPEAPVPVVQVKNERESLGGAANVAANIAGLGANCLLAGFTGDDPEANKLSSLLSEMGVNFFPIRSEAPTTTKVRILGDRQQMVRLDFENSNPRTKDEGKALLKEVQQLLDKVQVVILSDYGKGLFTPKSCEAIIRMARKACLPVLVDPKNEDWSLYRGASLVTPNFREFQQVVGSSLENSDKSVEAATDHVLESFDMDALLVTRSEQGMTLAEKEKHLHIHTEAQEVFDVSGAGDTVIAVMGCAIAAGMNNEEAARLANTAAGIVVGKAGTVPVSMEDLNNLLPRQPGQGKVLARKSLVTKLEEERRKGRRVVFSNGCFDVLHRGHLTYLSRARDLGDLLVVGLNSDASVRRLKGKSRPLNSQEDRAMILASLDFVDLVCIFDEDTPQELLAAVRPDILVKGTDYKVEEVAGREFAGKVILMDLVEGYSTTKIIDSMKESP